MSRFSEPTPSNGPCNGFAPMGERRGGGGDGSTNCIYFILIVHLQEPLEVVGPENRDFIEINR
jgi:hypothetical protein